MYVRHLHVSPEQPAQVDMECFASPLNCYYPRFCSAFSDTDTPFGSLGSFFEFRPDEGSYEANPPFVPEVIEAMAMHMESLLDSTTKPLNFVIIVPCWKAAICSQSHPLLTIS